MTDHVKVDRAATETSFDANPNAQIPRVATETAFDANPNAQLDRAGYEVAFATNAPPPPPPVLPVSDGWPGRAGRLNYGVEMRDERHTVDSTREFNAAQANLSFWQAGGVGLCAPKAVLAWQPEIGGGEGSPASLLYGAFTWDQVVYRDTPATLPSYLTITGTGTSGDPYVVTFATSVPGRPDADGLPTDNTLGFANARAQLIGVLNNFGSSAEVTRISANQFEVRAYVGLPRVSSADRSFSLELF